MISEKLIQFLLDIFLSMTEGLEEISISIPEVLLGFVADCFAFLFWFLPMDTVITIVSISLSIMVFRIAVSLIKTIWQLLPIL